MVAILIIPIGLVIWLSILKNRQEKRSDNHAKICRDFEDKQRRTTRQNLRYKHEISRHWGKL